MALALKVTPTTYPVYKNVLKVLGLEPIEEPARVNRQFVVLEKVVVLGALPVWQVSYYLELDFRRFYKWGDAGASWEEFTEVEEIAQVEGE